MKWKVLAFVFFIFGFQHAALASEPSPQSKVVELEQKINQLQSKINRLEKSQTLTERSLTELQKTMRDNVFAFLFFAFFCAWWAKTTGRSTVTWFVLAILFHVFTAIALVMKTERRNPL